MRIIHKPIGLDGDIMVSEVASIIKTDDVLSFGGCNKDCKNCAGVKIPGILFMVIGESEEPEAALYPFDVPEEIFVEGVKIGFLDLREHVTFGDEDQDEILEYLSERNLLSEEKAACYDPDNGGTDDGE